LVTGTGEAWSHPHSSGVLEHQWLEDGGYLGRPWAVLFNGSSTVIDCGSGATLDDVAAGGNQFTIEAWIRYDASTADWRVIVAKGTTDLGWQFGATNADQLRLLVGLDTTDAQAVTSVSRDGKWHHVVGHYNDATKTARVASDGVWGSANVGAGAYSTDAAQNFRIGRHSAFSSQFFNGAIGWVAYSNSDRYSAGTDFIPPRQPPATDGNHVEMWHLDEGTGATAAAQVTTPGNDGTISNGTWEEQWDIETSPIVPYSLEFDGSATFVNCGSAADIDDVPSGGEITIDGWFKYNSAGTTEDIICKTNNTGLIGWQVAILNSDRVALIVRLAGTDVVAQGLAASTVADEKWHYFAAHYDDATKTGRVAVDGIWGSTSTGTLAYDSEAAEDMVIGERNAGGQNFDGLIGYIRVSDNDRYNSSAGDPFTPPSRLNPPASDVNTLRQFNFRDGAGTTLTDDTATANGTITLGSGGWQITPDMEIDSPGERIFNWGYTIGNDAVDEGIVETLSGLSAGQNYVVRAAAHVESASRGRPKIIIYDETNGAQITALEGPSFHGNHDGLANSATLTDTTARFPQMLVGWTIYNITDGSSATITAISGDFQTITGALSGGTDDDWDISDEYRIVPPGGPSEYDDYPWCETFTFELPTIARNGAAADCTSISVKLVNGVND
jgi:hypothetical protein